MQMCQKQCRDENGHKCHCASEAHIRQMGVFAENPENFMNDFSKDFEKAFLTILKRKCASRQTRALSLPCSHVPIIALNCRGGRVHCNIVYQEYIADRNHIHMNATIFDSLSSFVQYLGRTGKATVDQTPKGWVRRNILVFILSRSCSHVRQLCVFLSIPEYSSVHTSIATIRRTRRLFRRRSTWSSPTKNAPSEPSDSKWLRHCSMPSLNRSSRNFSKSSCVRRVTGWPFP